VAVAAEKCAEDTKGQTCYICTQALHWKTKEGLVRGCSCRGTAGFAHVSCLAEQAKILVAEAEENNLGVQALNERWKRWNRCSLCEQKYHGVVRGALGWACWKTYLGRPETDRSHLNAMSQLGGGLTEANNCEDASSVFEVQVSMLRRLGGSEENILIAQSNLANTYEALGRPEALQMKQDVYSGCLRLYGEEDGDTMIAASNHANCLLTAKRFDEAKPLLRKVIPVARRILGESHITTLRMRGCYAQALYKDSGATLDDLHEAVTTLEDVALIARRVLGGAHPLAMVLQQRDLKGARAALAAREGDDVSSVCDGVAAMTPRGV
jgi:hypothetical protein